MGRSQALSHGLGVRGEEKKNHLPSFPKKKKELILTSTAAGPVNNLR